MCNNKAVRTVGALGMGISAALLGLSCSQAKVDKPTPQEIAKMFSNHNMKYQNELVMDSDARGRSDAIVSGLYAVEFDKEPPNFNYVFHRVGYAPGVDGQKGRPVYRIRMPAEKKLDYEINREHGWIVQDVEETDFFPTSFGNGWTDHILTAKDQSLTDNLSGNNYVPIYSVDSSAMGVRNDDIGGSIDKILRCSYPYTNLTDVYVNNNWVPITSIGNLIRGNSSNNDPLSITRLEELVKNEDKK